MKKLLLVFGLIAVFVVAGCSQSETEDTDSADQETKENGETAEGTDEDAVKKELLNVQLDLTKEIRPYHTKISAYQTMIANEEEPAAPEDIQQAAKDAKTAAGEAVTTLEGYEIKADLSDGVKEQYSTAITSLKDYYTEVQSALEKAPKKADLSGAQEKFDKFQEGLNSIYEDAGLLTPDMSAELS